MDVNPETGESKEVKIEDVYFYEDRVVILGWGTCSEHGYGDKSLDEVIELVKDVYEKNGYHKTFERDKRY